MRQESGNGGCPIICLVRTVVLTAILISQCFQLGDPLNVA